jgi:acetyltransferase-like isoleucine patch superfamily enzyme
MSLVTILQDAWTAWRLRQLRRQGLAIPSDCRLSGMPSFGSEPYLITIGHNVSMSDQVAFITHDGGTRVLRDQEAYKKVIKYGRITVLDNCVIGYRATILPGVVIGPNSVVSAGSVVTRNVQPNTVVAGNPAIPVMKLEQYAEWALAGTPEYDEEEYRRDKRAALLKMTLRGAPAHAPARTLDPRGARQAATLAFEPPARLDPPSPREKDK